MKDLDFECVNHISTKLKFSSCSDPFHFQIQLFSSHPRFVLVLLLLLEMDPASLVLSPALQVIFDRLASPALEKLAAIWGVEDNFHSLRDALMRTQAILQDAEEEQLTNKSVKLWLSNLKNAASDSEDLLDLFIAHEAINSVDFETRVSFFAAMMLNNLERIRKGYDAEKIRKTLRILEKTVNEGLSRFNFREPSRGDRRSTIRETGSCAVDSEIYGRDDEKKTLVKLLLSYETSQDGYATCIPVIGIGGIGKTTLTQLAYNDEGVLKHFNTRIWIFVSEDFDVKKIMKTAIERATKHKCKFSDIDSLQSELWKSLHNKRYLIVLDDLWTEDQDDWDKLRPLFRQGVDGCKIIVTTRSKKIPLMMDFPNSPFFLNGLTDVDCWSLFKQRAFQQGEEEKYPNLWRIGKKIVKKCGGVPLAAKSLGSSMRLKREKKQWLFMQDCDLWELDGSENKVLPALLLSYHHLPSYVRQCFAFCSIFPKNYEFKKHNLIHLWMAEGLIPQEGSKRPEDIGEEYFSELLWISFLQQIQPCDGGGIMGYKMNDVIHDLARYVAGKESVVLEHGLAQNRSAQVRHSSVVYMNGAIKIPETLYEAEHLRTLVLIGDSGSLQNGDKIYSSFEYLRVLDLNKCDLVDMPNSLGGLICLRYLDLSYTPITQLPESIQYLFALQTLNLIGCHNLESLPFLGHMTSLRHLNLSGCGSLTEMPRGIGRLFQLQTLPFFVASNLWNFGNLNLLTNLNLYGELNISRLENIEYATTAKSAGLAMKKNLESLGLYWGIIPEINKDSFANLPNARPQVGVSGSHTAPQQLRTYLAGLRQGPEKVIQGLQPHKNLKKLLIDGYPGTKFPHWVLPNLIAADFTNCRSCEHLPALGNLPLLKTLSLHGMHGVKSIGTEFYGDGTHIWFPSLEELSISDFANLEEWSNANDGKEFQFPKLKELTVKSCPNLAHIPLPQSLQHLELRDCNPMMMSVADLSLLSVLILEKIPDLVSLPDGLFASPNLSSLKILSCPKLHSMPLHKQNLSSLKSLTIHWCEELASLPQSLQNLKALESLEISDCHSLTSLPDCGIAGLGSLQTLSIENCSNLTSLSSSLEQLTLLEHLTIKYCPKLGSFPAGVQHLSSLRNLIILGCPWFDSLPEGLQNVKTLQNLEIRSCSNLTALPEWFGALDCLRSLTIYECPELEERCRRDSGEDWLKIALVPHKDIGSPQVR